LKHKFDGIGQTAASIIMAGLAANPSTAILASGFLGKVMFIIFKYICMMLANLGLIVMNVGAEKLETIVAAGDFDGSWEKAEEMLNKIRQEHREMTPDEIKKIDDGVITAFRKFASFGRVRVRRNP
jgi:hypothetical protein